MELSKDEYNGIMKIINKFDKNMELEIRIFGKNFGESIKLDYYKFENIINHLIFSNDNGGYGFKDYTLNTSLDIKNKKNDVRLTINGKDSVKLYWLLEKLDEKIDYKFIKKKNIDKYDIKEYNTRISLALEEPLKEDSKDVINTIEIIKDEKINKLYRLKNRYVITTPDKLYKFDLTSIKMIESGSLRKSDIFKIPTLYEIEIEYNMKDKKNSNSDIFNGFIKYANLLLKLYYNSDFIMKNYEINDTIEKYMKLVKIDNRNNLSAILANPVTLQKKNLVRGHMPNIGDDYSVTLKADGVRKILYVMENSDKKLNGNIYLLDNRNIINTGLKNVNWINSIIEGEFIESDNLFLAYDMLYQKNNDIRNLPLIGVKESRIGYLDAFIKDLEKEDKIDKISEINRLVIERKIYEYGENFFEKIKNLWDKRENYDFKVDGLIFMPVKDEYPRRGSKDVKNIKNIKKSGKQVDKILKWKPEEHNSIDFLVKTEKNEDGKDVKSPYIVYKPNGKNEVYQFKTLNLYVGRSSYDANTGKRIYKAVEFIPENESEPAKARIILDENERMMALDKLTERYTEILDDTIVEFIYDKSKTDFNWVPIKVRNDKTERYKAGENVFGNNENIAQDIWKSIMNPVTIDILTFGTISEKDAESEKNSYYQCKEYDPNDRLPMQNFHNLVVKSTLIKEVAPKTGGRLLDLACGKSGDLSKWTAAKYSEVVSIDIDEKCIEYAKNYYEKFNKPGKPEVTYIWGDTSKLIFPNQDAGMTKVEKTLLRRTIPAKYMFDVVSSQFCIHYYFESELKLRILLQNVNDNLKIGGYFIGTCFDGERVVEALKGKKMLLGEIDGETIWKIEKKYTAPIFTTDKSNYGKEIDVYVGSIGNVNTESLVNFDHFEKMAEEYGLEKVKVKEFAEYYEEIKGANSNIVRASMMSEEEQEFSFLNNAFIFRKRKNASGEAFKRIIKIKTKKVKK